MKKRTLNYLIISVILVIAAFGLGFSLASYQSKDRGPTEEKPVEETKKEKASLRLYPKPGEPGCLLPIRILSIDRSKEPMEMVIDTFLEERFLNPPVTELQRTILVPKEATITESVYDPEFERKHIAVDRSKLKVGASAAMLASECTLDILERDYFTAAYITIFPDQDSTEEQPS